MPKKNIKPLLGKPLIAYSIETALKSKIFDRIIVSTDDKEIAKISKKFGAELPFMRPKELAKGEVPRWPVLQHAVKYLKKSENYLPEIVVDLSPTSPLRSAEDIKKCLRKLIDERAEVVTTVYHSDRNPYFNMLELKRGRVSLVKKPAKKITQSQDAPKVYSMNDSINVIRKDTLLKNNSMLSNKNLKFVIMPRERSIDIDDELDLKIAESILRS